MRKLILVLLMFSLLPLTMAAGDNWLLHFSDGTLKLNGTDVCLDDGTCMSSIIAGGAGDITGVVTNGNYLTGGTLTGTATLLLNETFLNATITTIATSIGGSGDNSSWNETYATTIYAPINYGDDWNKTYADTLYAGIGAGADNESWNQSLADTLYADISVTDTNILTDADFNATQMENNGGTLNILPSWLTTFFNTLFGTKDTDDLTEGSTNLYDNQSWTEVVADGKYAVIGAGADNSSWNQSLATSLYADISVTDTDTNLSESDVEGYIFDADNTGDLETSGNLTGAYILGDGSQLTGIESASDTNCSVDGSCGLITYDSELSYYTDADIDGTETAFDDWDKNESDDFDGTWNSLTGIPAGFADGIDNQSTGGVDWTELTSVPAGFDDDIDNDTTYTAGTNLTLDGTEFQLNVAGVLTWLSGIFFDSEADLTDLLDDNYADISVTGDNSSWNQSLATTLYADISVTGDNSSFNQTLTNNLYVNIDGDNMTGNLNTTGSMTADDFTIDNMTLNGETYLSIYDYISVTQTSGHFEGGEFTDNGDGSLNVSSGSGLIRDSNSELAPIMFFDWAENVSIPLTDGSTNYIYISYNSGTPTIQASLVKSVVNGRNTIFLGKVFREGINLHMIKAGMLISEPVKNTLGYLTSVFGEVVRASGSEVSETGTLNLATTAGVAYGGLTRLIVPSQDTSGADTFEYYYYDGADWIEYSTSAINNTHYNNPASGLSELTVNKYGVHWVYVDADADGNILVVYGQGDYSLTEAEEAQPPSILPTHVSEFASLAAKIIIQEGEATFYSIASAYDTSFTSATINDHNELTGLQGGTGDEYYHLTGTEYTELQAGSYDNESWNQTLATSLYADISVVDTNVLTDADFNATQMENNGGTLNILESWLSTLFDTLFGVKDSDDLTEGSVNLYDNSTWNQTLATSLYADISVTGDNSSWNQTLADSLYADISVVDTDTFVGNYSTYLTLFNWNKTYADTLYAGIGVTGDNSSWNESLADTLYYGIDNPSSFYNATDFDIADYFTSAEVLGFSYYNSTDFSISDYYTSSQIDGFSYYNATNFDIADYSTTTEAGNLYEPISAHFDASTTVNITCINTACDWYFNATDNTIHGINTMINNLNITANLTVDRLATTNNLSIGICTNSSGDTFFGYIEGAC